MLTERERERSEPPNARVVAPPHEDTAVTSACSRMTAPHDIELRLWSLLSTPSAPRKQTLDWSLITANEHQQEVVYEMVRESFHQSMLLLSSSFDKILNHLFLCKSYNAVMPKSVLRHTRT